MKTAALLRLMNENGEALFLLRTTKPFGWGFPGGKVDEGETPEAACIRELKEETGISLTEDQIIVVGDAVSVTGIPIKVFDCVLDHTPEVTINRNEHLSYRWIKTHRNEFQMNYTDAVGKLQFAGNTLDIANMGKKLFIPDHLK